MNRGAWLALALVLVWACGGPTQTANTANTAPSDHQTQRTQQGGDGPWTYDIIADTGVTSLEVTACFRTLPGRLEPGIDAGFGHATPSKVWRDDASSVQLADHDLGWRLTQEGAGPGCVQYRVDVSHLLKERRGDMDSRRVGSTTVLSSDLWAWRPPRVAGKTRARLRFELPSGFGAATGSHYLRSGEAATVDSRWFNWRSNLVLGRFQTDAANVIHVKGARLNVLWPPEFDPSTREAAGAHLKQAADGIAAFFGTFPVPALQVVFVPSAQPNSRGGAQPIPFGFVLRGGGPMVTLLLDPATDGHDFTSDWVIPHELFHLGMPPIRSEDAWLAEGFTTYFTEIIRAQAGLLTAKQALEQLHQGFLRGSSNKSRSEGRSGRSLREESATMHANRAYFRVYWGGAAVALGADMRLHQRGGVRLQDAMAELAQCCAQDTQFWAADQVIEHLDAFIIRTGDDAPRGLMRRRSDHALDATEQVDLSEEYRALGMHPQGKSLTLSPEQAPMRRRLFRATPESRPNAGG